MSTWPVAELDGIARLRILAAGLPGVFFHERVIDHPFDEVWAVATDFEGAVPQWDSDVSAARVRSREGNRVDLVSYGPWWMGRLRIDHDVELERGWCWMTARRPRAYVVGMAAEPVDDDRTRFGHLEGLVLSASRWAAPAVRPVLAVSRWRHRHHVPNDVDGMERLLARR